MVVGYEALVSSTTIDTITKLSQLLRYGTSDSYKKLNIILYWSSEVGAEEEKPNFL